MGIPLEDPPVDDAEAKEVLSVAYQGVFGVQEEDVNLFALGIAQAIGLMEGAGYGKWGPGKKSNNWGAITRQPNADGSCPADSFKHGDSSFEAGEYETCFRIYPTSLAGAEGLLNELYVKRPEAFEYAKAGDIRGVAQEMYRTSYYMGVAPHNQKDANGDYTNVNNYIAFIGRGIDQIADLYPHGDSDNPGDSNSGMGAGTLVAALAAVGIFVAVLKA